MSVLTQTKKYTPSEYLALEEKSEQKNEYWNGEIIAMSSAQIDHQQIVSNVTVLLANKLKGRCRVFPSEMKVYIKKRNKFFYPDITLICGAPSFYKNRRDTIDNPKLIVEVLSKSTASFDRAEKFLSYQSLASLDEYVLISQETASVEQFIKREDENWVHKATDGIKSEVFLSSVEAILSLSEIYDLVEFGTEE